MSLKELKQDVRLHKLCITGVAFFGQAICVQRAFPNQSLVLLLCGLMVAALAWSWLKLPSQKSTHEPKVTHPYRRLTSIVLVVAVSFVIASFATPNSSQNALLDFAQRIVFAMLIGQIYLVAVQGFGRIELLVLATITTVTSFVCLQEPLTLYRQIAESAVAICLFASLANVAAPNPMTLGQPNTRKRIVVSMVVLALVIVLSRPVALAMDSWMPTLQFQLSGAIEESIAEDYRVPTVVSQYVDTASLNDVVEQYENDATEIALRVYSDHEPGYLRGRVFNTYRDGRWIHFRNDRITLENEAERDAMRPRIINPEPTPPDAASTLPSNRVDSVGANRFTLTPDSRGKEFSLEIKNDPRRGEFFFLPLQATRLDGIGQRILVDSNGIIQTGLDTRHSYNATVHQIIPPTPLPSSLRVINLRIPADLARRLAPIAEQICGDTRFTRAKARRLSDHFQKNFRYSLERREIVRDVDPIQHFLETRHAAHCEYFASATTLLLRSVGIPARYVTGYVVREKSRDEDYWIASNLNTHAWVEAYDDTSNRWFAVESTPGRSFSVYDFGSERATDSGDQSGSDNEIAQSWFDIDWQLWRLIRTGQWSLALVEFSEIIRWPLSLTTALLVLVMFKMHHRDGAVSRDAHGADFARLLRHADRRMKRQGLARSPVETIHKFAERIDSRSDATAKDKDRAHWYRELAELRYRSLSSASLRPFPQ